jgi:hypothetical protein
MDSFGEWFLSHEKVEIARGDRHWLSALLTAAILRRINTPQPA